MRFERLWGGAHDTCDLIGLRHGYIMGAAILAALLLAACGWMTPELSTGQRVARHLGKTMIKSTVGQVRRTTYDLPDAKNPNHVYGYEVQRDPENAGQVISKWVQAVPSPAAKSGRSFIETNRQAIMNGFVNEGTGVD
ncbi:unnamed protein product [Phytophthora fragariaefolia]|uniref:Unnamed protein product n=1 Tax=Phytophthora fragariaefolia TaxID=1490495 RepID=A0A9W6XQT6_9STRA|nr:unnamed protein product [Phytophthora fragariaefolia]